MDASKVMEGWLNHDLTLRVPTHAQEFYSLWQSSRAKGPPIFWRHSCLHHEGRNSTTNDVPFHARVHPPLSTSLCACGPTVQEPNKETVSNTPAIPSESKTHGEPPNWLQYAKISFDLASLTLVKPTTSLPISPEPCCSHTAARALYDTTVALLPLRSKLVEQCQGLGSVQRWGTKVAREK